MYKLSDNFAKSLKSFLRLRFNKGNGEFITDEFTFEVGDAYVHVRMADIYANEVARILVKPIDIRAATTWGFYFSKIHYNAIFDKFTYHFGNSRYTQV